MGYRLQLLPHLRLSCSLLILVQSPDLHGLPPAGAKGQAQTGAGARELEDWRAGAMGMDSSVARLCVLQSRCACESRHQLRELPWADQSHAGGFRCEADEHGVVPRVSSASGKFFAPGRPDHQFGLEARGREAGRIRSQVRSTKRRTGRLVEEETVNPA